MLQHKDRPDAKQADRYEPPKRHHGRDEPPPKKIIPSITAASFEMATVHAATERITVHSLRPYGNPLFSVYRERLHLYQLAWLPIFSMVPGQPPHGG